jgi:hypothetical protein
MTSLDSHSRFRPVNPMLGKQPRFGPIPSEQFLPWMAIALGLYILSQQVFRLGLTWTVILIFWGCATWWLLTGSRPWQFLSQFVAAPNWVRGRVSYRSILATPVHPQPTQKRSKPSRQLRKIR